MNNYTRIIKQMLIPRSTPGSSVTRTENGWRLAIPAGRGGTYRLAQLDDYSQRPRRLFPYAPSLTFSLRARLSAAGLPGTWGFGLWNDPFGLSLGFGGSVRRLPVLPNAAWFFYGSTENGLSFGKAPANGFFAGTFRSQNLPALLLAPGLLALPLLVIRPLSRLLRRLAANLVHQDGVQIETDVTTWHTYQLTWQLGSVTFIVDGRENLSTPVSPPAPLGLVIWIDNQYAAWRPDGRLGYGTLPTPSAWMEISDLSIENR